MYIDKLRNLIQTIETLDDKEDMQDYFDFLERSLKHIPDYFNSIIKQQTDPLIISPTLRFSYPEKYKEKFMEYEQYRREHHILMTQSINMVNRLCKTFNIPQVFETGLSRELYADKDIKKGITENMAIEDRDIARKIALKYYSNVLSNGINHEQTLEDIETNILNKTELIKNKSLNEIKNIKDIPDKNIRQNDDLEL